MQGSFKLQFKVSPGMSGLVWVGQEAAVLCGDNGRGGEEVTLYLEASPFTREAGVLTKGLPSVTEAAAGSAGLELQLSVGHRPPSPPSTKPGQPTLHVLVLRPKGSFSAKFLGI